MCVGGNGSVGVDVVVGFDVGVGVGLDLIVGVDGSVVVGVGLKCECEV